MKMLPISGIAALTLFLSTFSIIGNLRIFAKNANLAFFSILVSLKTLSHILGDFSFTHYDTIFYNLDFKKLNFCISLDEKSTVQYF